MYIGQTISTLRKRWGQHCSTKRGAMDMAIVKYGKENFTIKAIDKAKSLEELNEKEIFWIKHYNTIAPNGYNLTVGGNSGKRTPETGRKISKAVTGMFLGDKSPRSKKVYQFNAKGKLINEYNSTHEASRETGIFATAISAVCRGEHKYTKKYMWSYTREPVNKKFNRSYTYIKYKGGLYTIKELSKIIGISAGTIAYRKRSGWTDASIVNTPLDVSKRNHTKRVGG